MKQQPGLFCPDLRLNLEAFRFFYNYKNLTLQLISDSLSVKSIEFFNAKKSSTIDENTPYPVTMTVEWLNSYFHIPGSDFPEVEFLQTPDINITDSSAEKKKGKVSLDLSGYTVREIRVYKELIKIQPGSRISYGSLAEKSGIPSGARFIGNTMAKNRFPIIIPCHRVIRSDGTMGNYTGGNHIKAFLLDHESRA